MQEVAKRKRKSRMQYSAELRTFALTLQFYSSKAYRYVRKTFNNLLPEPSTIRKWYKCVDGQPGFTSEVFNALKNKVKINDPIICNLVLDEISIRQHIEYDGKKYYGYEHLGFANSNIEKYFPNEAKNALVFMLVALNAHWKVPIGYFLINSLNAQERASLLENCLQLIAETRVHINSITFDGAYVNIAMCNVLGANFEIGPNFKPYFINPATKEKIYCFFYPSHMVKLVRNTLGQYLLLKRNNHDILWNDIVSLQKLQEEEGLKAATKLTKNHISFHTNKMKVKLAAQTLSDSVSCALQFVAKCIPERQSPDETAKFCKILNDAFDICTHNVSKAIKL